MWLKDVSKFSIRAYTAPLFCASTRRNLMSLQSSIGFFNSEIADTFEQLYKVDKIDFQVKY